MDAQAKYAIWLAGFKALRAPLIFVPPLRPDMDWRVAFQCVERYCDDVRLCYALLVCLPESLFGLALDYVPDGRKCRSLGYVTDGRK